MRSTRRLSMRYGLFERRPAARGDRGGYARAEQFLPYNTAPLVLHTADDVAWLADGRLWYVTATAEGNRICVGRSRTGHAADRSSMRRDWPPPCRQVRAALRGFSSAVSPLPSVRRRRDHLFQAASQILVVRLAGVRCSRSSGRAIRTSRCLRTRGARCSSATTIFGCATPSGEEKPLTAMASRTLAMPPTMRAGSTAITRS